MTTTAKSRRLAPEQRVRPSRDDVRAGLLPAALAHFLAVGYRAAKLTDIAAAAGYTKGAIYSNFPSKQALFLELLAQRMTEFSDAIAARLPDGATPDTVIAIVADEIAREAVEQTAWHGLAIEFQSYAVTDPAVSEEYARLRRRQRDRIVERIEDTGTTLAPTSVTGAATAVIAILNGYALELSLDRRIASRDEIAATAAGAIASAIRTPGR